MKVNNNQQYLFAIVGSGKLAKAFAVFFTFFFKLEDRKQILFIGPQKSSGLKHFGDLGFSTSHDYQLLATVQSIIIAVAPVGIGTVLFNLKYIQFQPEFDQYIVCIVSGVRKASFRDYAGFDLKKLVIATTDTNISSGNGMIIMNGDSMSPYYLRAQTEFKMFGIVKATTPTKVRKSITLVGSWAAFNAKALWVSYCASGVTGSFTDWLFRLYENYSEITTSGKPVQEYTVLNSYLAAFVRVLKRFGYRNSETTSAAFNHAKDILFGTLVTFLSEGVTDAEGVTEYIAKVASKDGCTERGIGKVNTPADFASPALLTTTALTINQVVKDVFPVRIGDSIEEAQKSDGGHRVLNALASSNYPLG